MHRLRICLKSVMPWTQRRTLLNLDILLPTFNRSRSILLPRSAYYRRLIHCLLFSSTSIWSEFRAQECSWRRLCRLLVEIDRDFSLERLGSFTICKPLVVLHSTSFPVYYIFYFIISVKYLEQNFNFYSNEIWTLTDMSNDFKTFSSRLFNFYLNLYIN